MESTPEQIPAPSKAILPDAQPPRDVTPEPTDPTLEAVSRLVALKRHETPPPGFFRDFQRQLRRQIESETVARRNASPFHRFLNSLRARPAFAGANALIAAGLAVLAVLAVTAFLRSPDPISPANPASKQGPVVAGFGGSPSPSFIPVTDSPDPFPQTFPLRAGVTYRIEILTIDSNPVPQGIFTRPTPDFEQRRWPR
jgi:hypothetical protein